MTLASCKTQPVISSNSSRSLGDGPNKHFAFVYTKALRAGTWYTIIDE